jgi:O-antigen/teichoic acid export membrane protein
VTAPVAPNRPRGVLLGSASALVYLALQVACGLALAPLARGALGAQHYDWWLVGSQALAWLVLADLGLGQALTNAIVEARAAGDHARVARGVWTVTAVLAIAGGAILALGCAVPWLPVEAVLAQAPADPAPLRTTLAVLLVTFALRLPLAGLAYAWRGLQEPHRLTAWLLLIPPVQLAGAWVAFRAGGGLVALATVSGVVNGVALAGAARHLLRRHPALTEVRPRWDGALLRALWPAAWPFAVIQVASVVALQTDGLVLIHALGDQGEVAPYALPLRLAMMVHALLVGFLGVLWPALGDLHARGAAARVAEVWARVLRLTVGVAGAGAAGLVVLGRPVLHAWVPQVAFPPEGAVLLACFGAHLVLRSWVALQATAANALGLQRATMGWFALEAVVNLGLSLTLVWTHGRVGVAAATVVAVAIPALALPGVVAGGLGVPVRLAWLRAARACWPGAAAVAAASAAGVCGPAPAVPADVLLAAVIGGSAGAAAIVLGGTTPADRAFARQMLRRALGRRVAESPAALDARA